MDENNSKAQEFYIETLELLNSSQQPFLLGGAFAMFYHTEIFRDTKDLDIFCKPSAYQSILKKCEEYGFKIEITDPRWLAKASRSDHFIDIIFSSANNMAEVKDDWFNHSVKGQLFGKSVSFLSAEDLLLSKIYVQSRERYDGADLNHLILKKGMEMDWERMIKKMESHWLLIFGQLINFQFVYPSERDIIPKWVFDHLIEMHQKQYELPVPLQKVCRGPLVDHVQYNIDIVKWGYNAVTLFSI